MTNATTSRLRVLIVGGGYVGLYAAWGLARHRDSTPLDVTIVEPSGYMTYQPLLPEVAGGHVEPRNVTVPLQQVLKHTTVIQGSLVSLDHSTRSAVIEDLTGQRSARTYDHVIVGLGAVTRTFPTPGLQENAVGFKSVEEAVYLRDRVLEAVALAAATDDPELRRKYLTFVFIGGGYTGVEALAELSDLSKEAVDEYPNLQRDELNWYIVEMLDRIAPEVGPTLSRWTLGEMERRGIQVRLKTTMKSCVDGIVELSNGDSLPAHTIVWTAGVTPNPVLDHTDLPRGPKGHIIVNNSLQVVSEGGDVLEGAWAAGDAAQVPDLNAAEQPAFYPPNAQNALRETHLLVSNLLASLAGGPLAEYRYKQIGTVASFGIGRGAAKIKSLRLHGLPAWLIHRAYHAAAMPTVSRKWRIVAGWIVNATVPANLSALTGTEHPRASFVRSASKEPK